MNRKCVASGATTQGREGIRHADGELTLLAVGGDSGRMAGHGQLGVSSGDPPDGGQRRKATNILYVADNGSNT